MLYISIGVYSFDQRNLLFQKFPLKQDLPSSSVKRVFQDQKGFIWLGTESGICRYDGYNLKVIKSSIDEPALLTSGNILCIAQDHEQRMWFGTDRGLNIVDEQHQLVTLLNDSVLQNLRINSIVCDKGGRVWIGSDNGLFLYINEQTPIRKYYHSKKAGTIPGNNINYLLEDKDGTLWIGLWGDGLCRYNKQRDAFEKMPNIGLENNPYTIFQDNDGTFWVGTWSDGLFRFDLKNKQDLPVYQQYRLPENSQNLGKNYIYSITQDKFSGDIWILSHWGISVVDNKTTMQFLPLNVLNAFTNASNFLNQLYRDRQGNIWIATANDGVYLANPRKALLHTNAMTALKQKNGFIDVTAIIENKNELWLGLRNFGIYVVRPQAPQLLRPLLNPDHKLMMSLVRCFFKDPVTGDIWIGGGKVLAKIDSHTGQVVEMSDEIKSVIGLGNYNIQSILIDSRNNKWIAYRKGMVRITAGGKVQLVTTTFNNIQTIVEDTHGIIWAGSSSKGVLKITPRAAGKLDFEYYNRHNKKTNSDEINTLFVSKSGVLWAGTNNGGLSRYDANSQQFLLENKNYQLLDNDIKAINEDDNGNIWLSANNKIIKIDVTHKNSIQFSSADFSEPNNFEPGSTLRDSKGMLYFGGANGYSYFYPHLKRHPTTPNNISVTDIRVNNQSIFQNHPTAQYNPKQEQLQLGWRQRNLGLEFSALNYNAPEGINYAYRLSGVDKEWVYVDGKRRYVNYNNLDKGSYVFEVKATDENGVWQHKIYQLHIAVAPAPYETWWAILLYIVLLATVAWQLYRTAMNRIRLKRDLIISKIREEKTEELAQLKLSYFTNISHELLTPLTIIACLIDDFHHNFPSRFKQYSIMKSNVTRLKHLLQQILDFRKIESGNMKLSVQSADIVEFVQLQCGVNFEPLAQKKSIHFSITGVQSLHAFFDADKLDKILFNLLSNAFKYTPEHGTIQVTIEAMERNELRYARIFVNDTGEGIAPDRLPHIFDQFYGNQSRVDSNGIGLSLSKQLVELHKGTISVRSELNTGTCFVVEIPIDEQFYSNQEIQQKQLTPTVDDAQRLLHELEDAAVEVEVPEKKIVARSKKTILIVEDNSDLLMVLNNTLSRFYQVITANNGQEAIERLNETEVDVVLSDVMMPIMDGLTMCKHIKDDINISHTPVLLLTAKNQMEDRIDCYNAGADAYISKPFEMEVLTARINSLLHNRQKRNQEFRSGVNINTRNYDNDSLDGQFLRDAIRLVEENLANFDFTHEQLMDKMNTSKSTLYRKIKSLTGLAPSDFVRNIRLKHACQMLKGDVGNISDIAYAVGFNDPKYFSTCFKSEFGVTPREFAKGKKPEPVPQDNAE